MTSTYMVVYNTVVTPLPGLGFPAKVHNTAVHTLHDHCTLLSVLVSKSRSDDPHVAYKAVSSSSHILSTGTT